MQYWKIISDILLYQSVDSHLLLVIPRRFVVVTAWKVTQRYNQVLIEKHQTLWKKRKHEQPGLVSYLYNWKCLVSSQVVAQLW